MRADKETAVALVIHLVPHYLEVFNDCKDQSNWQKLCERFQEISKRLNIANYVLCYEDERRILSAVIRSVMSPEDQIEFEQTMREATHAEQQEMLRELARPGGISEVYAEELFPTDPKKQQEHLEAYNNLPEDKRQEAIRHAQYLMIFVIAWLHESLAVMVHGERMTSLVPKALAGDSEAFAKAVHIDKNLIYDHPQFQERYRKALADPDKHLDLLGKISRRLATHVTVGRQKLPGVFFIFALLESLRWLDDLPHREILDICDAVGLDVPDENAITKALGRYRRYQKTGGVSMH